jgi:hypothetical protein
MHINTYDKYSIILDSIKYKCDLFIKEIQTKMYKQY